MGQWSMDVEQRWQTQYVCPQFLDIHKHRIFTDPAYAAEFSEVNTRYAYLWLSKWGHWKPRKATLSFCFTCRKKIIVFCKTWKTKEYYVFSYSCYLPVLDNCGRKGKDRATKNSFCFQSLLTQVKWKQLSSFEQHFHCFDRN